MDKNEGPCPTRSGIPADHGTPPPGPLGILQEKRQGATIPGIASGSTSPTPMDLDPIRNEPSSRCTPRPVWQPYETTHFQSPLTIGTASHQTYGVFASPDHKDHRVRQTQMVPGQAQQGWSPGVAPLTQGPERVTRQENQTRRRRLCKAIRAQAQATVGLLPDQRKIRHF